MKRLSIDVGFGDVKVSYMDTDNTVKPSREKHLGLIAKLGDHEGDESSSGNFVDYEGLSYVIGTPALQIKGSNQMKMETYEEFKELSPIIIKKHLRDHSDVDQVIISLSLAFEEHAGEYKEHICEKLGLKPENVFLLPQGVGAKLAIDNAGFNLEDISFKANLFNYIMIDIGYNTIDIINVVDGFLIKNGITGYPEMGVVKIVKSILEEIRSGSDDNMKVLTEGIIKSSLTNNGQVSSRGLKFDLTEYIQKATLSYIEDFVKFFEKEYSEQLNSIEHIILIGGGAELINIEVYRKKFDEYYKHDFVKVPVTGAEYYNAVGGLYFPDKVVQ